MKATNNLPLLTSVKQASRLAHKMDTDIGIKRIEYILHRGERIGVVSDAVIYATRRYSLALFDTQAYLLDKYNLVLHSITL
jgi:hypothetical protein